MHAQAPANLTGSTECPTMTQRSEAIEMTTPVGGVLAAVIMATPFYDALNCHHHWMSDLAAALSLIWRLRILVVAERSMSLLKRDLPALTTLQAWLRRPIRYSRSLFLPCFLSLQEARHALSLASFSWGSLITSSSASPLRGWALSFAGLYWHSEVSASPLHDT